MTVITRVVLTLMITEIQIIKGNGSDNTHQNHYNIFVVDDDAYDNYDVDKDYPY